MAGYSLPGVLRRLAGLFDGSAHRQELSSEALDAPGISNDARLEFLGSQLELLASDRQSKWTLFASLAGIEILAAGAFLALSSSGSTPPENLSPWIWTGISLVQVLLMSYGLTLLIQIGINSYYAREVERQVSSILGRHDDNIPPAVSESVNVALVGHRRGLWQVRAIYLLVYLTLGTIVFASATLAGIQIELMPLRVVVLVALVVLGFVDANLSYTAVVRGADVWVGVKSQVLRELDSAFPYRREPRTQRRLISYLAVPRPNDLLVKGVFLHLGSALVGALLVTGRDWSSVAHGAAVSFLSFEFLMYQGRYMFNDRLGVKEDAVNPEASERGRLPILDTATRRYAVWAVIGMRAALAVASIWLVSATRTRLYLAGALAATWILAMAYENLRKRIYFRDRLHYSYQANILYAAVGGSYAIRAGFGLYVGSGGSASGWLFVAVMITFYLLGIATVLMVWVLESTLFIGTYTGCHRAALIDPSLGTKNHLLPLAWSAGILSRSAVKVSASIPPEILTYRNERVLRPASKLSQPWNLLFVLACMSSVWAGWIGAQLHNTDPFVLFALTAVGVVVGLAALSRPIAIAAVAVLALAVHGVSIFFTSSTMYNLFMFAPLAIVVASYTVTRGMNYIDSISLFAKLRRLPGDIKVGSLAIVRDILR